MHTRPRCTVALLIVTFSLTLCPRLLAQDFDTNVAGATCAAPNGCVATYHNDNNRTGVYSNEIALTPGVVQNNFGLV